MGLDPSAPTLKDDCALSDLILFVSCRFSAPFFVFTQFS